MSLVSFHTKDPRPRTAPLKVDPFEWPVKSRTACSPIVAPTEQSFQVVFEERRSQRSMGAVALGTIVNTLGFAMRPRYWKDGDAFERTRRPALSAGALHPLSVLICPFGEQQLLRYDATSHFTEDLQVEPGALEAWALRVKTVLPNTHGSTLFFVADNAKPNSVYELSESLIWRDGGALLQTIALACTAYDLAFCPLGLLGSEVIDALNAPQLITAGTAVIGTSLV
jgi:hypothetical protein